MRDSLRAMAARFITFEGIDGSGKSTQLRRVGEWMHARKLPYQLSREPGGTAFGSQVREIFLDHRWSPLDPRIEGMLLFASRRQNLLEVVEPALAAGTHVLCDRFTDSSFVYQGMVRGLGQEWVERLDELATGGRRPDATLLFDLDPKIAYGRRAQEGGHDRIDAEDLAFYSKVRDAYLALARQEPERFHLVEAGGTEEETWQDVEEVLRQILEPEA